MSELITPDLVRLDVGLGSDKQDVIRALAAVVAESGRTGNADGLATDVLAREATSATGMPGGIAIPHCRTEHVDVPTLVFARLAPPTDFGAKDGPADLTFLIAAPAGGDDFISRAYPYEVYPWPSSVFWACVMAVAAGFLLLTRRLRRT